MGLKSAQAWGCPCSMKCLFKDLRSALAPFPPLLCTRVYIKKQVLEISRQIKRCSTNGRDLPHSTLPFVVGMDWIADYGVDYEIKVSYSQLRHRVPYTTCFSLNTVSARYIFLERNFWFCTWKSKRKGPPAAASWPIFSPEINTPYSMDRS